MVPLQWASLWSHCAVSLQGSGRGGDPAPQLGHFSPGRRTKVVELPGPEQIARPKAGLHTRMGRVCFGPC